jgi:hypothetical protein
MKMTALWDLAPLFSYNFTKALELFTASIIRR